MISTANILARNPSTVLLMQERKNHNESGAQDQRRNINTVAKMMKSQDTVGEMAWIG